MTIKCGELLEVLNSTKCNVNNQFSQQMKDFIFANPELAVDFIANCDPELKDFCFDCVCEKYRKQEESEDETIKESIEKTGFSADQIEEETIDDHIDEIITENNLDKEEE
ncbi:hypothetical protein F1737_05985 [Methanoplanus sp. FWC-SCC4]|uniref:Uncharacterized protein n=1 Tax=Methanochimaera problematica TaxID=2609417 RepID=A0AA97FDM1_9EURY|nr:hypothetical protein [Methanoplanus sp. FWC-SCC4]WOF16294.1 hypothetical protein F1737_05985 [Methanoplanus sp. FWC-SCC4]